MRLVQLRSAEARRVALVEEPGLPLLRGFDSVYALALEAIRGNERLPALVERHRTEEVLEYDAIYRGEGAWKLALPIDHPEEPARCLVSGTGLTHLGSARDRQAMHGRAEHELTDSMKMFRWGLEGGRPGPNEIGIAPEWFYKGNGTLARAHGEPLIVPGHADDGGEEAELAAVYVIGSRGNPYRVGMTQGNEFSDHVFEKKNYLNLAGSKLRTFSLGPELRLDPEFESIPGSVSIERKGQQLWRQEIATGEAEMCHSLRNLEHHHFKFAQHRRPGDVHVHFLGAHSLSFGQGIQLKEGDVMEVQFHGFGRALRNPVEVQSRTDTPVAVHSLA